MGPHLRFVCLAHGCVLFAAAGCTSRVELPDVPLDASFDGRLDAPRVEAGACGRDADCGDRIACTIDLCEGGTCRHEPCLDCCETGLVCDPARGCAPAPRPCTEDADCLDDVRCTLDFCRDGFCEQRPNNALCDPGQICLAAVGCIPEPPATCESSADCDGAAACVGEWQCEPEFGCQFVSARDCDDADACTSDRCDEAMGGCVHDPLDADGDGHSPASCAGDDCDDADPTRHAGAAEVCGDGIDQNCDGNADDGCCTAGPCVTPCGTAGTLECRADGTPGACLPPVETCDGRDEDCDGRVDETFSCALGASEACDPGCGSAGTRRCEAGCVWSTCGAPTESCNGVDDDCDGAADDGFACSPGAAGPCPTACGSTGSRSCTGGCTWDLCVNPPESCNGMDDDCDAACDDGFACCRGSTRACSALGFFAGTAVCRDDCGSFDTSGCTDCGDGVRDPGEACDGADLGVTGCAALGTGFAPGGTLRCAAGCMYDTSGCTRCGNGMIDAGEQCDGTALGGATCAGLGMGFTGGTLGCSAACRYVTSACTAFDPSGLFSASPTVSYSCAFGLVSLAINRFTFSDSGAVLTVSGAPCVMSGPSARSSRNINVTCSLAGTCTETYSLIGSFTDDNRWSGTFSATFTGGSSCFDCTNQSRVVSGTRL